MDPKAVQIYISDLAYGSTYPKFLEFEKTKKKQEMMPRIVSILSSILVFFLPTYLPTHLPIFKLKNSVRH